MEHTFLHIKATTWSPNKIVYGVVTILTTKSMVELFFCRPYCLRRYPQEKLGWALVKHRFHFCQTRIQAADKDSLQIRFACQLFHLDLYLQG